ncbi:hypothetical protein D3C81_1610690 [compost metagenome]
MHRGWLVMDSLADIIITMLFNALTMACLYGFSQVLCSMFGWRCSMRDGCFFVAIVMASTVVGSMVKRAVITS